MEPWIRIIATGSIGYSNACVSPPKGRCKLSWGSSSASVTHLASVLLLYSILPRGRGGI